MAMVIILNVMERSIVVNGRMDKGTVMVNKRGPMVRHTMETGLINSCKAKGFTPGKMVGNIMENGRGVSSMEKVLWNYKMALGISVTGSTMNVKAMVNTPTLNVSILEAGGKESAMVKEPRHGQIARLNTLVSGQMVRCMVKESMYGLMVVCMMVIGSMASSMVKVSTRGQMALSTMETGRMDLEMDMEHKLGRMIQKKSMMVIGPMTNEMEKGLKFGSMVHMKVSGRMMKDMVTELKYGPTNKLTLETGKME